MDAYCSICGRQWDIRDPGVRRIWGDDAWECYDEPACFDRRALAENPDHMRWTP
ncbi:MAG TPA: hypothetical protein VEH31_19415 [Streptosporangiaceae bacterium]|nr:hypothetical protein [Streptosporangiaceae bacterium]